MDECSVSVFDCEFNEDWFSLFFSAIREKLCRSISNSWSINNSVWLAASRQAVQYSVVQCSAVRYGIEYSAVQYCTLQYPCIISEAFDWFFYWSLEKNWWKNMVEFFFEILMIRHFNLRMSHNVRVCDFFFFSSDFFVFTNAEHNSKTK